MTLLPWFSGDPLDEVKEGEQSDCDRGGESPERIDGALRALEWNAELEVICSTCILENG